MEDDDSVYPSITIVLSDRFNETKLKEYDETITPESYLGFLTGSLPSKDWNPKLANVDFEEVTMDINDYVIRTCLFKKSF